MYWMSGTPGRAEGPQPHQRMLRTMSNTVTTNPNLVTYGNYSFDYLGIPAASVMALLHKGFAHLMGNEAAARVTAWKEANPEATPEAIAEAKTKFQSEFMANLLAGTIGHGTRGPRGTAAETIARELAEKEVRAILTQNGLNMPSKDNVVSFPNGDAFTRKQLIDRRMANHGERLMREAEAELKARARKIEKEIAAAKASGAEGAASLGL